MCPPTARRISLGGEGNALYPVLSLFLRGRIAGSRAVEPRFSSVSAAFDFCSGVNFWQLSEQNTSCHLINRVKALKGIGFLRDVFRRLYAPDPLSNSKG